MTKDEAVILLCEHFSEGMVRTIVDAIAKDEALQIALEALTDFDYDKRMKAIETIKRSLETKDEPVAHLWECLGRWSAYLANNGMSAELAPPSWLVDAINNATTPQRRWVGLTYEEETELIRLAHNHAGIRFYIQAAEAKLKERNT